MANHAAALCLPPAVDLETPLTVFCDFDGPIVDVSDRYYQTYLRGLEELQADYAAQSMALPIQRLSKSQFWQMKQERTPDHEIAMRSGLQGEEIYQFLQRVCQIVNQTDLLDCDRLQPGVRWALSLLHAQGVRLVLVTLRCQEQVTQMLTEYGLLHLFSGIWGACNQAAAYANHADHKTQLLAKAIAAAPHSGPACMIGDTEADVLAGQAAGIDTIAVTCGIRSQSYLQKLQPTQIQTDLLTAAHWLAGISA